MASRILLLEDDKLFNETLQDFLEEEGFEVEAALDPHTALELTYDKNFDLYLFDINLPYESGIELLSKLRESSDMTPTIFLTSRDDKESLIEGLNKGADDYIRKPVDLDELLARIRAIFRRQTRDNSIDLGSCSLDIVSKRVLNISGEELSISHKAIDLLLLLLESDGSVVGMDKIEDRLWSASEQPSEGAVRVYISQLKKYFPDAIENIRGIGYRFDKNRIKS